MNRPMRLALNGVTIAAGRSILLSEATVAFEPGQVHVIVGPSGAGKSLLLQYMAGLIGPGRAPAGVEASGSVAFLDENGEPIDRAQGVCLVPQYGGLFLEFTTDANVRFGADHRWRGAAAVDPRLAMETLRVPRHRLVRHLSGGEARRCAVARALAAGANILLLDEPTAGLDPVAARRMASLVADTCRTHGVTAIVVTHDYEEFLPVADRVYVLNPRTRQLEELSRPKRETIERLFAAAADNEAPPREPGRPGLIDGVLRVLDQLGDAALAPLCGVRHSLPGKVSPKWLLVFFLHYLRYFAGPTALVYLLVAGLVAGFVSTYFTFQYLPYRQYLEPLVMENVLSGIGFTLFRVTCPVLVTLLVAARCGSAIAADVGIKSQTGQLDAMRSVGASPRAYLEFSVLWSFLLGTILLGAVAYAGGLASSLVTFSALYPERGGLFWRRWFHAALTTGPDKWWWLDGTGWVMARLALSGWLSGLIAYEMAASPKRSELDVSRAITLTVLVATLAVLVLHVAVSLIEF